MKHGINEPNFQFHILGKYNNFSNLEPYTTYVDNFWASSPFRGQVMCTWVRGWDYMDPWTQTSLLYIWKL